MIFCKSLRQGQMARDIHKKLGAVEMKTSKNGLTPILAAAAAKEPWKHWGVSEKSLMGHAKSEMKRLKARTPDDLRKLRKNNRPSFPQDGSSGQYDAWSESLAQMLELEKQGKQAMNKQAKIAALEAKVEALEARLTKTAVHEKTAGNARSVVVKEQSDGGGLFITFREYMPKGQIAVSAVAHYGNKFEKDTKNDAHLIDLLNPGLIYDRGRSRAFVQGDKRGNILISTGAGFNFADGTDPHHNEDDQDPTVADLIVSLKSVLAKKGWKPA